MVASRSPEPVLEHELRGLVAFTAALGACTAGAKWEALAVVHVVAEPSFAFQLGWFFRQFVVLLGWVGMLSSCV